VKALIHVVPCAGEEASFAGRIRTIAEELRQHPEAAGLAVNVMFRVERDPFGPRTPYRAALEIDGEAAGAGTIESLVAGIGQPLAEVAHPDLSTLLMGEDVVFEASIHTPVRYQYLMRRNASFSHAAYLARYREIHAQFGLKTPGIRGYVQFHVDPEASRDAARRAGLGVWDVDSVSELHLESVETFLGAVASSSIGAEAIADEEIFVDRANSFDFCSKVEWQGR